MREAFHQRLLDTASHARTSPILSVCHDFDLAVDKVALSLALKDGAVPGRLPFGRSTSSPAAGLAVKLQPSLDSTLQDAADRAGASDVVPADFASESQIRFVPGLGLGFHKAPPSFI
jgi:hypothetical protein